LNVSFEINNKKYELTAVRLEKKAEDSLIKFSWKPDELSFSEILEAYGIIPLPPYINREMETSDLYRYQTIYAQNNGSVAAPTAGLHFTAEVMDNLAKKNIETARVTLHVGAGTFKPVTAKQLGQHQMHTEQVFISKDLIRKVLDNLENFITIVGTTSTRTIESLYWQGVKWINNGISEVAMDILQWDPYILQHKNIPVDVALQKLIEVLDENNLQYLSGNTQLLIAPGYEYKIPHAMITNFHQPGSTLLLLLAAFIGESWRGAYQYALENDFRFLSYGDSCLFFR